MQLNKKDRYICSNIIYSGSFSKMSGDYNRGAEEIILSRAGTQGLVPPHYLYARLYGSGDSNNVNAIPL
jgi:hypothetical protein